jgi:hypothetical protein
MRGYRLVRGGCILLERGNLICLGLLPVAFVSFGMFVRMGMKRAARRFCCSSVFYESAQDKARPRRWWNS